VEKSVFGLFHEASFAQLHSLGRRICWLQDLALRAVAPQAVRPVSKAEGAIQMLVHGDRAAGQCGSPGYWLNLQREILKADRMIVFGLVPAIRSSKASSSGALSQTGRTGSTGAASSRLRSVLVAGEVALAVVILTAASVDIREVTRELREPNGFNPQGLLSANLDVSSLRYKQLDARIALFQQVTEKVKELPELEDAALDSCVPMGCFYSAAFPVAGRDRIIP
jgi:hypothetical protein